MLESIKLDIHNLKRRLLHRYVSYKKSLLLPHLNKEPLLENDLKILSIASYLIKQEKSKLSMCPVTHKRYINNGDYFVVIHENKIQLVNHVYAYDVQISGKQFYNLKRKFNDKLHLTFYKMEKEILKNVKHSLDEILITIKQSNE
jgi:hypothetical protein